MVGKGRRMAVALLLGGLVLAAGWAFWLIRPVLTPFFLAVAVAYLLAPFVNGLARWGLSRGWAILAIYLLLGLGGALAVSTLLPRTLREIQGLTQAIPLYSLRARELVDGLQQRVREMGAAPELREILDRNISDLEIRSVRALEQLFGIQAIRQAAGLIASLILAPILAFYLLKDIDRFKERFVRTLPSQYRQEIISLLRGLDGVLTGFVRGQILLSLAVGAMAIIATAALGLRYALLLGIWAGLTEFVPYVGPLLGAIPAVLTGLSVSPWLALETLVAFAVIQQVENAVLSPKIMGESVGLHPLVVMLSVLAGGYLIGPWGLILALPTVGIIRVLWCFLIAQLTMSPVPSEVAAPAARPEGAPGGPDVAKARPS